MNDLDKWRLSPSDFIRDFSRSSVGSSYFSISFHTQKSTGRKCIIKRSNDTLSDSDTKRNFFRAVSNLSMINHPSIVPFIGFYEKNNYGYLIEEEIEQGDLESFKELLLSETNKLIISYGIACAMEFLHNIQIMHRDIKPKVILLNSSFYPLLTSFKFSKKVENQYSINQTLPYSTPKYMAPEFINDPPTYSNSFPIDVYSYGITLYELITGLNAFADKKGAYQIFLAITRDERPKIPDSVPSNWRNLITKCWTANWHDRPTFTEICDMLESKEFVNNSIDLQAFKEYKKIVKPFRPSPKNQSEEEAQDLQKIIEEKTEEIDKLNLTISTIKEKEKKSQETIQNLEEKLDSIAKSSFNPFDEEKTENENDSDNYFIGSESQDLFKTIKKIGEGATSITYKIIDTRNNKTLCKKVLKITDESSSFSNAQSALKEFEVLRLIRHPCICKAIYINLQEPIEDNNKDEDENDDDEVTTIALYLEFLCKSLKDCIDKKLIDNTLKVRIVVEIAHAMNFIHKKGMIHRDLKIENIMLNSIFESKIVDFGLVRIDECFSGQSFVSNSLTKGIGTLAYMSPEMVNEEDYDNKTDVYSFGIVLHYIFTGKLPTYNMKDKMTGKPIPLPKESSMISKFGIDLISKCTNNSPSKRPSFDTILELIRKNSYSLAPEIDQQLISKRDRELSFFESSKL